jgi:hypothetical protein
LIAAHPPVLSLAPRDRNRIRDRRVAADWP